MTEWIEISKEVEFDAGHRVPSHLGKCKNPHGHRYRVRVSAYGSIVEEEGAPDHGMLVDFGDLKTLMMTHVHDVLDHGFIVYEEDRRMRRMFAVDEALNVEGPEFSVVVFPYIPTAENLARWIWEQLDKPISERFREGLTLSCVEVWETPTSLAVYRGPEVEQCL